MAMVRYAARIWAGVFAIRTAIVVSLNQAGNGTERWQIRPVQSAVSGLPGIRVAARIIQQEYQPWTPIT